MIRAGFALGLAVLAAGCGKIPVEEAQRVCAARMQDRSAVPISATVKAGLSNGRMVRDVDVDVAPSVSIGAGDPAKGYNACVQAKSGQYPSRPYTAYATR